MKVRRRRREEATSSPSREVAALPPKSAAVGAGGRSATVLAGGKAAKPNSVRGKLGDRIVEWEEGTGKNFRCGVWNSDGGTPCPYSVMVKITNYYREGGSDA